MQRIKFLLLFIPVILIIIAFNYTMRKESVLVCYGKLKPETVQGYHYVILESNHYLASNIRVFKAQNKKVFAYFSMGEVNENAPHYTELKDHTLGKNEIWNSYYLDLNTPKTREIILHVIESIFQKGFDGIFMDNFDNYAQFGPLKSQKAGIIALLKELKAKYPEKLFLQNAGMDLLQETHPYICGVAFESIASDYQFPTKTYRLREAKQYQMLVTTIQKMQAELKVPVVFIEYADQKVLADQIHQRIDTTDFEFFIGKIDLQTRPNF
ncbi:MAG: hypothetical protein RLZZ500_1016 [Bacteroidota bacterium]|jgi:uncharacterized protein (TIGR01370 family)